MTRLKAVAWEESGKEETFLEEDLLINDLSQFASLLILISNPNPSLGK